jgi:hypothetical protein
MEAWTISINPIGSFRIQYNGRAMTKKILVSLALLALCPLSTPAQTNWIQQESGMNGGNLLDVAANPNGPFVAVGWDFVSQGSTNKMGIALTSSDGVTWTRRDPGTENTLNGIAWVGNRFIAVGNNGNILTSSDGTSWSAVNSATGSNLLGIVWNGLKYVIVGENGKIQTSNDGSDWTLQNSGTDTATLNDAVWAGDQFVVVGENPSGVILTSDTGTIWDSQTPASDHALKGVEWNNSKIIAVGAGGKITTSSNGIVWSGNVVSGVGNNLNDVTVQNNNTIVAVGAGGTIVVSTDTTNWTRKTTPINSVLNGVIHKGTRFVAVGDGGTILASDDASPLATATPTNTPTPTLTPTPTETPILVPALEPAWIYLLIVLFGLILVWIGPETVSRRR